MGFESTPLVYAYSISYLIHVPFTDPAYMKLLPPVTPPPSDVYEFLDLLSSRLGMLQKGGERDHRRAAVWFIKWWREEGGLASARAAPQQPPLSADTSSDNSSQDLKAESSWDGSSGIPERSGWGFDFEWEGSASDAAVVQARMEERIEVHVRELEEDKNSRENVSLTQEKKQAREEKIARRRARGKMRN